MKSFYGDHAMHFDQLWPKPHRLHHQAGYLALPPLLSVHLEALPAIALSYLSAELLHWNSQVDVSSNTDVPFILVEDGQLGPEAYRLTLDSRGIRLEASSPRGRFYAVVTLCQWLRCQRAAQMNGRVSCVVIEDEPDFPERGIMLDISRNKVPTLASLFQLIDLFAQLKINQLQLYLEHSFAYVGHEQVWREASPLTPSDVEQLVAYCGERFIELVPNQNSFGHFHRWLVHEAYRPLAECPEGVEHAFSSAREPFSLCATDPKVMDLLKGLYGQLLPLFPSRRFNVGLDETFDLGMGRSAQVCEAEGKTEVYLGFLRKVHRAAAEYQRQIMFWGDIIIARPDLLSSLPEDVIALEWGYEAGHPFAEHGQAFARSGRTFYVCPGTSSWNSFAGRLDNAMANLSEAARHGKANGARGYLITDWGDRGHLQPLPVSYPGFLVGAALAWNSTQNIDQADVVRAIGSQVGDRPGAKLVQVLLELGQLHARCGATPNNGSALFFLYWFIDKDLTYERLQGLSAEGLEATRKELRRIRARLYRYRPNPEDRLMWQELLWLCSMLDWCARLGLARFALGMTEPVAALPAETRQILARDLKRLADQREPLWLSRNRPGGWAQTRATIDRIRSFLC